MPLVCANLHYIAAQNVQLALDIVETFLHFKYLGEGALPDRLCFERASLGLTFQCLKPPVHGIEASVHSIEASVNGIEAREDALFKRPAIRYVMCNLFAHTLVKFTINTGG